MNYGELKIGYVPYLPDLSQPADRRRFPFFAKRNNVPYEIADVNKTYDIVLLTAPSDLSKWLLYKNKHPKTIFIFEIVDSLIFPSDIFSTIFKGLGRFLLGKEKSLYLNYHKLLVAWFKTADLVICSNTELKNRVGKWNKNVVVSLDYLENEYLFLKTDYSIGEKVKLFWEGQGIVLRHFNYFKDLFKKLAPFCELHIITSDKYPSFGNLIKSDVRRITRKLPIKTYMYKWDLEMNKEIIKSCDCGIIPLNKKNLLGWYKPANKLISFWFAGLPTVVSDTPAYKELMDDADSKLYCSNTDEWISKLKWIRNLSIEERKEMGRKNLDFVRSNYSNEALDKIWQDIFKRLSSIYFKKSS